MRKGIFSISLDFELIWGTLDLFGKEKFERDCRIERAVVIDRLLELFGELDISATWLVVGHLFLDKCEPRAGVHHPEIVRPQHSWVKSDWFSHDPGLDERSEPLFYARHLVEKIRDFHVHQEIGSHSFSHIIYGDIGCSEAAAESDLKASVRAAAHLGILQRSFAFPRDRIGHLDVLRRHGITAYRTEIPLWYERGQRTLSKRLAHLWDVLRAATPPVGRPSIDDNGLCAIPGSMIYFPLHGMRQYIPMSRRVARAIKGLDLAVKDKAIFHLWFHPTNMAAKTDRMFAGLRSILEHANSLRQDGKISVMTMPEIEDSFRLESNG